MTRKINVKEFLDRIGTSNLDGLFKVSKDGAYVSMTYKQMMEDVFKGRTELTMKEVFDIVDGHTYAPFILFKIKGSMPPQDIDEWWQEEKKKIKPLSRWYFENGTFNIVALTAATTNREYCFIISRFKTKRKIIL